MRPADTDALLDVLAGKHRAQAVSTVAALGVADRLMDGPRSLQDLARELDCDARALQSVMRVAASLGFFSAAMPGVYALTERGRALCADALGPLAAFAGSPPQWDPWSRLRDCLRTDRSRPPFEQTFDRDLYRYLSEHPEAAASYDLAIEAFTRHEARLLLQAYDFATATTVADVGGGRGVLLQTLLEHHAQLHGVLIDLPHVVDAARAVWPESTAARVELVAADFTATPPPGADVYVLKHVLHNWDDTRAGALLARCKRALHSGGRVLVIETILTPGAHADLACLLDLEMHVLTRGRERQKPELRRLLGAAGLRLERAVRLSAASHLLVAAVADSGT